MISFKRLAFVLTFIGVIVITALITKRCTRPTSVNTDIHDTIDIGNTTYNIIEHTSDTVYVTNKVYVDRYIPKYYEITNFVVDTVYETELVYLDTQYVFNDYNSIRIYKDTIGLDLHGDTLISAIITDSINRNLIKSREILWTYNFSNFYSSMVVEKTPVNTVFFGFSGGFSRVDYLSNLEASLILQTKTHSLYQIGVGLQNNSNVNQLVPYIHGGVYWKIKL